MSTRTHRLFLLRAYGDATIALHFLANSPEKNNYEVIASSHLNPLIKASQTVGGVLKKGDIVVYESTVYPGCTEEVSVPVLENTSGLKFNVDFFCGYSPERINPGDKVNTLTKIKKITSGSNEAIAKEVDEFSSKKAVYLT